jgi:isoleucyl-tRNA synthetase
MNEDATKAAKERYKPTVLLPRTDFPMKAGLQQREPELQQQWAETDLYGQIRKARQSATPWVLHDGPPYANGDAHTGTGMNKILKDMVVKFRTMQGFDSPYVPGWDCHGLPIEHNVLKELGGKKPDDMSDVRLRELCLEYADKYVAKQREQFKTAGVLGRWEQPYLTTSPEYEAGVLRVFKELVQRGYVERAKRPVHWSWAAQSALAEAELEYEDRTDPSIYVRMPVSGVANRESAIAALLDKPTALLIWTTTPWTLPANVAIAVSADAEYALVEYGEGERMVLAVELVEHVCAKAGIEGFSVQQVFKGEDLTGLTYTHALWGTTGHRVVTADYVTLDDGTGLVHTAPGHGKEDFETGHKYGLPVVCPVSPNGTYYTGARLREELQLPADFSSDWFTLIEGQHIFKVNDAIVDKLRETGLLLHSEPYPHSYPHCWRTHTPVIFRVTEQWFVRVDHVDPDPEFNPDGKTLRERLLDEIARVKWFPKWGEKRIGAMVGNRPDWCISRQRFWGIPIPAFEDAETGRVCMTAETVEHVAQLVAEHGSNVWYEKSADELLPDAVRPDEFKGRKLQKMEDIFDVWFESGASHRSVMLTDPELKDKFPASLYLEGDDQHRGWFQVSLILSVATQGKSPFEECLTSAFVVDEKGEKGSKSKGNIWALDKGAKDLGADLIRFYFATMNTSDPIPVTYDLIRGAGDGYRKVRNTFRALVGNLFDFDPAKDAVAYDKLLPLDRWALSQCARVVQDFTAAFDRYEFHTAMRELTHFCNVTLSSIYVDVCKDRMYCEAATGHKRRSAQTAYWKIAGTVVRLLSPVLVHTVEDMQQHLPGASGSAHLAAWPVLDGLLQRDAALDARYASLLKLKYESDRVLDRMRKEKRIGKGYDTAVIFGADEALLQELASHGPPETMLPELAELLNVSAVDIEPAGDHSALQAFEPAVDVKGLWLQVTPSAEVACVRCFRRTGDVGTVEGHEHICARCADVVGEGSA